MYIHVYIHVHVMYACTVYLAFLSISGSLSAEEDGERGSLRSLGHVDNLLQSRYSESHVLGGHSGIVEGVEGHLSGGLTQ